MEVRPKTSKQHEFQGSKPLVALFGLKRREKINAKLLFLGDGEVYSEDTWFTWYDSREDDETRTAEYRLFYSTKTVQRRAGVGDLLVLAVRPDGLLLAMVAAKGSAWERKLTWLFDLPRDIRKTWLLPDLEHEPASELSADLLLQEVGMELPAPTGESDLDEMLTLFPKDLPATKEFSAYARSKCTGVDAKNDPDHALTIWVEKEYQLFRLYEAHQVSKRVQTGFLNAKGAADVDAFFRFAKSCQQRRFSRVGYAFQDHVAALLVASGVRFTPQAITEAKRLPDFVLPGVEYYHDRKFPKEHLVMLAVKTTLRERFKQVPSEADRIEIKHLLTLDPRVTPDSIAEMKTLKLQMVLPKSLHTLYHPAARKWFLSVRDFIEFALSKQQALSPPPKLPSRVAKLMREARARKNAKPRKVPRAQTKGRRAAKASL